MPTLLRILIYIIVGLPLIFFVLHMIARIIRHFHKFPIPEFAANIIDNPLRRRIQPPEEMPLRHRIEPGMTVLEVGPGNGTYTLAAARRIGNSGKLISIDIEPKMIERLERRARVEGIANIEARVADVFELPFEDGHFDAVYMIAVIGEIPTPERAMREFHRVLSASGTLAFSELLVDPDFPLPRTLERLAASAGFRLIEKMGGWTHYTVVFEKCD
jgi:ubiquinone/menaquinone biosynthesis C-methylase UbiE